MSILTITGSVFNLSGSYSPTSWSGTHTYNFGAVFPNVRQIWADTDYVFAACDNGLNIVDIASEEQYSYILYTSGFTTVWANDEKVFLGTSNSGIKYLNKSDITGSIVVPPALNCLQSYATEPTLRSNDVRYIHGSGNLIVCCTASGAQSIGVYEYENEVLNPNIWKCFPTSKHIYYTVSGTTDRQLAAWLKDWGVGANKFRNPGGDLVEKPSEAGPSWSPGGGGGGGGGGPAFPGGGPGGLSDWWGTLGDAPVFEAPTWESAMEDPGYQAALKAGEGALERSQAARGVLRSDGSLKDLLDYNQGMAAKQYDSAWQRALGEYSTKYEPWATKFGAGENCWATMYGGDLAKWQTQYQGDLAKYLQKEGNLFDLLNSPPPMYGG